MKKMIALLTALWTVAAVLVGCGDSMPTPEEIFQKIENADSVRMEMLIHYDEVQTSSTVIEEQGDISRVYMETESFGAKEGEEYFLEHADGKRYIYTQTAENQWKKSQWQDVFTAATISGFSYLFDSKLYYVEEDRYRMYDTESVEFDGYTFNDVEIFLEEDGNYRMTAVVSQVMDEMPIYGSVTIRFTLGGVEVKLPAVS